MGKQLVKAYSYCANLMKQQSPNFYYASIFLPKVQKDAARVFACWLGLVDKYADSISIDGGKKRRLLSKQYKLIDQFYEGNSDNPITVAFHDTIVKFNIKKKILVDIVKGFEMDQHKIRYKTFAELKKYCYHVAICVGLVLKEILGHRGTERKAAQLAHDLGIALQLTNILRDVKEDLFKLDRIYLPKQELEKFGLSYDDLRKQKVDSRFVDFMKFQINRTKSYYRAAYENIRFCNPISQPSILLLSKIYEIHLDKIESVGYDIFNNNLQNSIWDRRRAIVGVLSQLAANSVRLI